MSLVTPFFGDVIVFGIYCEEGEDDVVSFFGEELKDFVGYGIRPQGFARGRSLSGHSVVCTGEKIV